MLLMVVNENVEKKKVVAVFAVIVCVMVGSPPISAIIIFQHL